MRLEDFRVFALSMLADEAASEGDGALFVSVLPGMLFAIRKAALTDENKARFLAAMRQLPEVREAREVVSAMLEDDALVPGGEQSLAVGLALLSLAIEEAFGLGVAAAAFESLARGECERVAGERAIQARAS